VDLFVIVSKYSKSSALVALVNRYRVFILCINGRVLKDLFLGSCQTFKTAFTYKPEPPTSIA
jgi:hypothetical protein